MACRNLTPFKASSGSWSVFTRASRHTLRGAHCIRPVVLAHGGKSHSEVVRFNSLVFLAKQLLDACCEHVRTFQYQPRITPPLVYYLLRTSESFVKGNQISPFLSIFGTMMNTYINWGVVNSDKESHPKRNIYIYIYIYFCTKHAQTQKNQHAGWLEQHHGVRSPNIEHV